MLYRIASVMRPWPCVRYNIMLGVALYRVDGLITGVIRQVLSSNIVTRFLKVINIIFKYDNFTFTHFYNLLDNNRMMCTSNHHACKNISEIGIFCSDFCIAVANLNQIVRYCTESKDLFGSKCLSESIHP